MTALFSLFTSCLLLVGLHFEGPVPADLGLHGGSLSACATPAHCARTTWAVADPTAALAILKPVIQATPRTEIVADSPTYLHATATSRLFGFVDDLELHASPLGLEARSISRLGDSDLGVNKRRLELLHEKLMAAIGEPGPG